MDKETLRKRYLDKRKALLKDIHQKKSKGIARLLLGNIPLSNFQSLHTFLPIERNREVDTYILIRKIRTRYPQLVLVVPKIRSSYLEHYIFSEATVMAPGPYDVPEPQGAKSFDEQQIQVVLVPLLIFDKTGHRIGYGKGYYDRFLSQCPKAIKIGLSLFAPVDRIPEVSPNDVALDMVVTPDEIYRFE